MTDEYSDEYFERDEFFARFNGRRKQSEEDERREFFSRFG